MQVRLKDIAEKANVSISTVSRVINNDRSKPASKETSDLVWKIVNEMGYVPNMEARNLIKGQEGRRVRTNNIGCIYTATKDSHHDPFFSHLGAGIQAELDNRDYVLSFALSTRGMSFSNFFNYLTSHDVDGIIIMGRFQKEVLDYLTSNYANIVYAGVNYVGAGFDEVICDAYKGAVTAVEYLIGKGHIQIGFIGDTASETQNSVINEHRYRAFYDTMKNNNLEPATSQIISVQPYTPLAYKAVKAHLKSTERSLMPTAFFCSNDATAIGSMRALQEAGYSIPGDVAIVGFDDIEIASYLNPRLTTIHVPKEELGTMAVKVLTDRIENGREYPIRVDVPFTLKVREST